MVSKAQQRAECLETINTMTYIFQIGMGITEPKLDRNRSVYQVLPIWRCVLCRLILYQFPD